MKNSSSQIEYSFINEMVFEAQLFETIRCFCFLMFSEATILINLKLHYFFYGESSRMLSFAR